MPIFKMGNVSLKHKKGTRYSESVRMNAPASVTIPMVQHIGAPAKPTVKVGDRVLVGSIIGEAGGFVSAPIHSSVSGTVKKIELNYLLSNGATTAAVIIESDGLSELDPMCQPKTVTNPEELACAVRESGLVGLGGAGFPTSVKFDLKRLSSIDTVVINAAECEPYITSDTRTVIEEGDILVASLERILSVCGIKRAVIGIEKHNKEAIATLSALISDKDNISLQVLPTRYPQGVEKVLVYNTLGRIVPEGGLPADVGVIVLNVTTATFIEKYIRTGIPLIEKRITVDGSAIKSPQNVIAPIGTPVSAVVEFIGGFSCEPKKILFGGPMMGVALYSVDSPVIKNTNAIVALSEKDAREEKSTACIHCGRCVSACPMNLNPVLFAKTLTLPDKKDRAERLDEAKVNLCIECGCCSYVCPAKRPLVTNNKLAKAELRAYTAEMASLKGGN